MKFYTIGCLFPLLSLFKEVEAESFVLEGMLQSMEQAALGLGVNSK